MALGGRQSIKTPNNQPKVGGSVRGDDRGEARRAGGAGKAKYHRFGVELSFDNKKVK